MVSERTQTLLAVVFAVLLLPAGAVVAQTATHSATAGTPYVTNSGVEVTLGDDRGDVAAVPFDGNQTFADKSLRVSGRNASVEITDATYSGDPVTISNVDADPGNLTVERTDLSRNITFESGDAATFQLRDYNVSDGTEDFAYSSTNGVTVTLGGFNNIGVGAIDTGTGEPVDSGVTGDDGRVTLELPAGDRSIELQKAPSVLEVRDEQNPGQLLTGVSDLTIEFYQQTQNPENVEEVPVTNGTADMDGLDPAASFVAVANADGYANRRIFIESLFQTQEIYLLNESADSVSVEFELEDFSGDFPQARTVMVIEKNIGDEWTPIQGDFFGSTGKFEAQLLRDSRHRMRVVNIDTGQERVVGAFTPLESSSETVTVLPDGSIEVDQGFEQIHAEPAIGSIPAAQGAEFGVTIQEGDEPIENWQIEIIRMNGTTETTLATRSGSGASTETFSLDLSTDAGGTVMAVVDYQTPERGGTVRLSRSIRENYAGAEGLLGGLITIGDGLGADDESGPSGASMLASLFVSLLVTAGVARVSTSADVMGITALTSVTGFAVLGWVPMSLLFAATVGFGAMVVLRRGI